MAKAAKKNQTSSGGSSSRKGKNGNGGKGNGKGNAQTADKKPNEQAPESETSAEQPSEEPKEKKRRGRAPTEGEPLKRVLIFLSEADVAALKSEVGDRGMSTKVREIIKEYLAKQG